MATAKQVALAIAGSLPDDCTLKDAAYRLYLRHLQEKPGGLPRGTDLHAGRAPVAVPSSTSSIADASTTINGPPALLSPPGRGRCPASPAIAGPTAVEAH